MENEIIKVTVHCHFMTQANMCHFCHFLSTLLKGRLKFSMSSQNDLTGQQMK